MPWRQSWPHWRLFQRRAGHNQNATESLDLVIGGTKWQAGDEAVMAEQDYGSMLDMFKLVAKKHGVVNRIVSVPNHPASDEEGR